MLMVDANDCEELAPEPPEGNPAGDAAPDILFVRGPDRRTTKSRLHFDLRPMDQSAQVDRLIDLGAERSTSASPTTPPGW
jgi:hypothetical protein